MNFIDEQLNRLFRAAAKNQQELPMVPFGLETRVMAAWRDSLATPIGIWNTAIFVRGLILASVIMAISFWPALNTTANTSASTNPFSDFLQLTDSTVPSDTNP